MTDIKIQEFMVNMGPQHPSTHGVLKLIISMDGEVITKVDPEIGFLHRSIEKIVENRNFTQIIPFMDRLEYLSSMFIEYAYIHPVEKMMGVTPPPRAEYLRVIMMELNRIASHLVWMGTFAIDLGAFSPFLYAWREREAILELFEMVCGARMTFNYFRIGGVKQDIPEGFLEKMDKFLSTLNQKIDEYEAILTKNSIFIERTKGIGIIKPDRALNFGVSGPNIRASGIDWDLRKTDGYSVYPEFEFDVPVGKNGDCFDRYSCRIKEMRESARILTQASKKIPSGEIRTKLSPVIKPPQGETYTHIESPRGDFGVFFASDGSQKPYRLKFRTPSFSTLMILPEISTGLKIADLVAIIGSLDLLPPEIDR